MAETIDDTETGTIALTHVPKFKIGDVICNIYPTTPSTGTVVGITATGYSVQNFTGGMFSFGFGAERSYELCAPPAPPAAPAALAKGQIVGFTKPATVAKGASFDITAMTKNTGGSSGTFKMQLYINGALKATSPNFTLAAGATSSDKIPAATAPTSGTSMTYDIKCIRIS